MVKGNGTRRMRRLICVGAFGLVACVSASAQTAPRQTAACPAPPRAFPPMTYDEDTRYLPHQACRPNPLERLKFIPLFEKRDKYYLSFRKPVRERGAY